MLVISARTQTLPLVRTLRALLAAAMLLGLSLSSGAAPARADDPTTPPASDAAAAPAAAVSPALGERVLRFGDTGADVVALQALLGVDQTGTFDTATRRAVKRVQRAAGLPGHGVVGPKTLKAITKAAAAKRAGKAASRALPRTGTPSRNRAFARVYIARQYGWGAGQMSCLSAIWARESGWRHTAHNPNGRYHGIPQTSSSVWRAAGYSTASYMRSPAVQIKVGTKYIKSRYGTPCGAWSFWRSHHWY